MIEEAAAMTNQSISQFMVSTASERAAEVIDQHRRLLNEESWNLVMDAIINPPAPNDRLKRAANRLGNWSNKWRV
uniref:Toxin-antitoxin system, antitoxin component n=2 Tax=Serratia marcescens TaxID=615 RepID=A0A2I7ZJC9_SERMA|nr:toxin-antitoxin system, antitoxin component [Serratia marcescens]